MANILTLQAQELCKSESNLVANLANISALINDNYSDLNWVGFYLYDEINNNLVLSAFQGKIACTRIAIGKGVCGTAFASDSTQVVEDVHLFPGHIACDSASNSEIVIPLRNSKNELIGVLDIDSPMKKRFSNVEKDELEELVFAVAKYLL